MAIDFPNSPSINDQYTVGDRTWTWNGTYWQTSTSMSTFTASDSEPVDADAGDIWFDSTIGKTFINYSGTWVEIGNAATVVDVIADADADTKVQVESSADEDKIRFSTAGTERVIVDNAGNVGIGTTSPTVPLDVVGDVNITTASGDGYLQVLYQAIDTALYANLTASGQMDAQEVSLFAQNPNTEISVPLRLTGSTVHVVGDFNVDQDTLFVDSTNNRVGIGTTSPTHPLHISTNDPRPIGAVSSVTGSYIDFRDATTTGEGYVSVGAQDNHLNLVSGGTIRATLDSSGKFGIGTTNPSQTLHVNGKGAFADAIVTGASTTTVEPWSASTISLGNYGSIGTQGSYELSLAWNWDRNTSSTYSSYAVNGYGSAAAIHLGPSGIKFQADASWGGTSQPTEHMRIAGNGNVNVYTALSYPHNGFSAYSTKNPNTWSGAQTIVYNNTIFNSGNCYSTSTGRYTAPRAGYYYFRAHFFKYTTYNNSTNTYWGLASSNGYTATTNHGTAGSDGGQEISMICYLSQGDYVYVQIANNSSLQSYHSAPFNSFSGYCISA